MAGDHVHDHQYQQVGMVRAHLAVLPQPIKVRLLRLQVTALGSRDTVIEAHARNLLKVGRPSCGAIPTARATAGSAAGAASARNLEHNLRGEESCTLAAATVTIRVPQAAKCGGESAAVASVI